LQNSEKLSRRYAKALIESCDRDSVESMRDALFSLKNLWLESQELRDAILNPANSREELSAAVGQIAQSVKPDDEIFKNFLLVLLDNDRFTSLPQISVVFSRLVDEMRKVLALEVTSASPLSEEEKTSLLEKMKVQFGSLVSVQWNTDQDIIGGLLIRSGDKLIDRSIRGSLSSLKESLLQ